MSESDTPADTLDHESDELPTDYPIDCPACGSMSFQLRSVDEFDTDGRSIQVFCSNCGNATGKMSDGTVDNRIAENGGED